MKRGFPFTPKPPAVPAPQDHVLIPVRNQLFANVQQTAALTGKDPAVLCEIYMSIGMAETEAMRLKVGIAKSVTEALEKMPVAPPEPPKKPEDSMTEEEYKAWMAENRRQAGLEKQ